MTLLALAKGTCIITEKRAFYDGKIIEKVSMMIEKPELVIVKATFEDSYVGRGAITITNSGFSIIIETFSIILPS